MDFPEKQPTRIEPNLPAKHRDPPHRTECNSREAPLLRHLCEDSVVDQIKKLGHHSECRDLPFPQRFQQFSCIERRKKHRTCSSHERQQQIRHLRKHMEQRKHTKNRILRPNMRPRKNTFSLAQQIRMCEHYALGIGGGSRSVEKGSEVIGSARHRSKRSILHREDTVKIRYCL